ncbi:hypothetical protein LTAR_00386 [Leptolinea tardivitalis]|nr:hypothetical protein LTAR_00386 [Leptolinea tardivitalis]
MQTCSICHTQVPDSVDVCPACKADLSTLSEQAAALKKYRSNPRVQSLRVAVAADCCPACRKLEGTYSKEDVPILPAKGCSHENGCRCFYEPILNEIYP